MRQGLEITKTKLGKDYLQVAVTLQSLDVCLRNAGRYNKADEMLRKSLE